MSRDTNRWLHIGGGEYVRTTMPVPVVEEQAEQVEATKAALDAADELGVDLSEVKGSGKGGKVTKADVEALSGD